METSELFSALDTVVQVLTVALAVLVFLLGRWILPKLSFFLHRRAVQVFSFAAVLFLLSESVETWEAIYGQSKPVVVESWITVVAKDTAELVVMACIGVGVYLLHKAERKEISLLKRSADIDELTNLSNRSFFRRAAMRRIELCKDNDIPLTCAVIDVDDFKPYNDRYGHEAGDRALRCVARALRESVRAEDIIARYGGKEFALLMSGDLEEAAEVAERVRKKIEHECSPEHTASLKRRVTVSLGLAPLTVETRTLEQLIESADRQMYRAKRTGKNRVLSTEDGRRLDASS